jgi:lysophospholipase L1-like esterase
MKKLYNDTPFINKKKDVSNTELQSQLAQKATKTELQALGNGSPKGVYVTLTALQTAFPNGTTGIYVVSENGNWYYWNGSTWTLGGTYLSTPDGRVNFVEDELNLRYNKYTIKNGIANSDFSEGTTNFGSSGTLEILDGKLKTTKNTTDISMNLGVNTDLPYKAGHKYYTSVKVTPLSAVNNFSLVLYPTPSYAWSDYIADLANPTVNQEYNLTSYIDGTLTDTTDLMFFHVRAEYAIGTNPDSFLIYHPMMFDLTAIYGVGNEPTKEEFETKLNNNFDGFIIRLADDFIKTVPSKIESIETQLQSLGSTSHLEGKKIVNFGDSIFGSYETPTSISSYIANKTGATVYNVGFGGCRMGHHYDYWDAFSMYRLADAVATGNFTLQDQALVDGLAESVPIQDRLPSYFPTHVTTLKGIDFNTVDYVTIAYGTNDWFGGNTLEPNPVEGDYDSWSFKGALRYSIEKLITAYPHLKIMVLTPIYRTIDATNNSDNYLQGGQYLYEFVQGAIDIAKEYHVPALDNYYDLGFNKINRNYYFPVDDGIHPNPLGRKRIGEKVASALVSRF